MDADFAEFLGKTSSTDVLDEGGRVKEQMICGGFGAFAHVPSQAKVVRLDPMVGNALERASVFGKKLFAGPRAGLPGWFLMVGLGPKWERRHVLFWARSKYFSSKGQSFNSSWRFSQAKSLMWVTVSSTPMASGQMENILRGHHLPPLR